MEELVDFKIIKEKIIKTDSIINLFLDSKKKNAELKKTLHQTYKKYKQSIVDIDVLKLENERKVHHFEEQIRQCEKLKASYTKLQLDYCSTKEECNNNLNELQVLQMKYQSTCKELVECQELLEEYKNTSTSLPIKVEKKRRKKKNCESLENSKVNELRNCDSFSANETAESDEEGKLLEMNLTENLRDKTEKINLQLTKPLGNIEVTDHKSDEAIISKLKTEIEQLSAFSNILKEEVNKSNEAKNTLNKDWDYLLKSKEASWLETEQKLRLEVSELKKRLELYEKQNNAEPNFKRSIFDCEEETNNLTKNISKEGIGDSKSHQVEQQLSKDLSGNIGNTGIVCELLSFPACDLSESTSENVFDTGIEYQLPSLPACNQSDSESASDDINDILIEMRMTNLVSPFPPSEEDQISLVNSPITRVSPKTEITSKNISIITELESNCHISDNISNESNFHIDLEIDKYNKCRLLKAKRLNNLLNIKKAKELLWLRKSKLIMKSKSHKAKASGLKIESYESDIDKSIKKSEQYEFHAKNTSVDDIVTVLADLVSQKLRYPRPRKKSSRLNQIDDSKNVLEVNRMLLKKARQLITTPNNREKDDDSKEISGYDNKEHSEVNNTIYLDALLTPPVEIGYAEHFSNSGSSERSSSEMELPISDSCYESLISNPPSIENNIVDDKKIIIEWQLRNRFASNISNAEGFQSDNFSLDKVTHNLNTETLGTCKQSCDKQDTTEIVPEFVEQIYSVLPSQNAENGSGDHNFEVKEKMDNSDKSIANNVQNEITNRDDQLEKSSPIKNETVCSQDHNFELKNPEVETSQEYCHIGKISREINENINQKVSLEPIYPLIANLETSNDTKIFDSRNDSIIRKYKNKSSQNRSQSEFNKRKETLENCMKISDKKENNVSDMCTNNSESSEEENSEGKIIEEKNIENFVKIETKMTDSIGEIDNFEYEKTKNSIIHNNVLMKNGDENYKDLFENITQIGSNMSSKLISDNEEHGILQNSLKINNCEIGESLEHCRSFEIKKQDLVHNQKVDILDSENQPKSVNQNTLQIECGESIDNKLIKENQIVKIDDMLIAKSYFSKDMDSLPVGNLQTQNGNTQENSENNHDIFQIIEKEKSIINSKELQNINSQKEIDKCQIEDLKPIDNSMSLDEPFNLMKKASELDDILLSENNLKNDGAVSSLSDIEQDRQLRIKNDGNVLSLVPQLKEEGDNNCYKLFHYNYDDTSLSCSGLPERETTNNWEEPTNRSNEGMWYEFGRSVFNEIRISKSYNWSNERYESGSGNVNCESIGSDKTISFKRHSEDEFPNFSKILKFCDFSSESTNDSVMEMKDASEKEIEVPKNKEIIHDGTECWKYLETTNSNQQNEYNIVTTNDKLQKVENDDAINLEISDKLNTTYDMEIDLDTSKDLFHVLQEEYLNDDSSVCVSSIINDLICESQRDIQTNNVEDDISDNLNHHSEHENEPEFPDCNDNCLEKLSSDKTQLTSCKIIAECASVTEVAETTFSNDTDENHPILKIQPILQSSDDEKSPSRKKIRRNSNSKSKIVRKYNLRKSAKLQEENISSASITEETLTNESLSGSNKDNVGQEENKSGSVSSGKENPQSFNREMDLIGSCSEFSDEEITNSFQDITPKNCNLMKQTRKSKNCRAQTKKKAPAKIKRGVLMKKSIRTYRQKNFASNFVEKQIVSHERDTTVTSGKSCSTEDKSENDISLNGCKSCSNNSICTSKHESNYQYTKTCNDSLNDTRRDSADDGPQSGMFKRTRSSSGSYSITSVTRTSALGNITAKKKESKFKKLPSACPSTEDMSSIESKSKPEITSSNDYQKKINSFDLRDVTSTEQNINITVKKIRKSLVDVANKNEYTSPSKIVKKNVALTKRISSSNVDYNTKHENSAEISLCNISSNKLPLNINNRSVSCLKGEKINILQEVIFRPSSASSKSTKLEIKAPGQMRISGFKRPNNTKIIPPCPQSPPPPSADETVSRVEPVIIPLEKPPKMDPSKAAVLFRKLITYSREEKTVEEVVRQFTNQDVDHIARLMLEQITQDNEKANKDQSSAPLMTDTQRVMMGFMLKLELMNVENLISTYLKISEMRLLQSSTLREIETITRVHVAICKSHKYIERMRRMCCDAFYFMGDLAIPFFYIVLVSWIEVLPVNEELSDFPMVKVLIQLVNLKDCNIPGYNLLHLRELLNKYYKYPNEPWNSNSFFQELFNKYLKNPVRPSDFAILLYCKNNASKWVYEKVNNLLKPTLANIKNENFKATVIILIGNITSQFNGKVDGEYVDSIRKWFKTMIEEEGVSDVIKKSIILSLRKLPKTSKKPEISNIVKRII